MNRLVLVDGNAILHRAYHALPPLTDPNGTIVNAVYGFTMMLLRLYGDLKPSHLAVAFDRPAPTFRKELYKEYQATRPKMDDDLSSQIPKVHSVVAAMGIPIFEMDGFEADDVIGTIVEKAIGHQLSAISQSESGKQKAESLNIDQVIIVTGDRDIMQLAVDEKVLIYMPTKGLSEARLYGEKETVERMGVTPTQIPDFKALAGDSSDHYPGVAGIGPKTAVNLLTKYGSIEHLYKELEAGKIKDFSDAICAKLTADKENALMSHNLATIRRNVPIDITILPVTSLDTPEARAELETLGFKSLLKKLNGSVVETDKIKKEKKKDDSEQLTFI
jgi:DNA polymerase I